MDRIDAHQHFWKFDPIRDSWITEAEMSSIRKNFLPEDLKPLLKLNNINSCIAVQSSQSEEDNNFLLGLATENSFIAGIVGWIDLQAGDLEERLQFYSQDKKMKGFRHVLQGEKDEQFMLRPAFKKGIALLNKYNFTYDILIYPCHLKYASQLVSEFPDQPFVLDHLAKPDIKNKSIEQWKKNIVAIAKFSNVSCKVSGMVTEAHWTTWKNEDFTPYLDVVFNSFGINRVMYGSDWPVCNLAGGYNKSLEILKEYTSKLSQNEQSLFFGGNAINFYKL